MTAETFLGFDYGERRIGVAVGQSVTGTATPLATVRVRGGEPDWASIDGIVATWSPAGLVVGEPLHMDGRPQAMTRRARRFRHALESRFGLPVHAADERLTTVEARAALAERGAFRGSGARRRHELDHPVAARLILESWLGEPRPEAAGPEAGGDAPAARRSPTPRPGPGPDPDSKAAPDPASDPPPAADGGGGIRVHAC